MLEIAAPQYRLAGEIVALSCCSNKIRPWSGGRRFAQLVVTKHNPKAHMIIFVMVFTEKMSNGLKITLCPSKIKTTIRKLGLKAVAMRFWRYRGTGRIEEMCEIGAVRQIKERQRIVASGERPGLKDCCAGRSNLVQAQPDGIKLAF